MKESLVEGRELELAKRECLDKETPLWGELTEEVRHERL